MEADVFSRLQAKGLALCVADSENFSTPVEITAGYAYFRLRDEGYQPADIERWAQVIREKTAGCSEVFVYFKHEEAGIGTEFAKQLIKNLVGLKPDLQGSSDMRSCMRIGWTHCHCVARCVQQGAGADCTSSAAEGCGRQFRRRSRGDGYERQARRRLLSLRERQVARQLQDPRRPRQLRDRHGRLREDRGRPARNPR